MRQRLAEYARALGRFSFALLGQMLPQPGNILISGPSVGLALAMTMNGAAGPTYLAMSTALGLNDLTETGLNQASQALLELLNQAGQGISLALANSLWLGKGFELNADLARILADYYLAQVSKLDFSGPGAADSINQWVAQATAGKIDSIVADVPPAAALYLLNAVHFQADWQYQFDQDLTRKRLFLGPAGELETDFMHSSGDAGFIDNGGVKGVTLAYKEGAFFFFALLPPPEQNLRNWLKELDWLDLLALLAGREYGPVELALPKFTAQSEISLVNQLTGLGMGSAFSENADFSRLSLTGQDKLRISEVKHKAFCQIDEKGTEAAAATTVQLIRMSLPLKIKEAVFDRPFLFGIIQEKISLPLFLGLLENPLD